MDFGRAASWDWRAFAAAIHGARLDSIRRQKPGRLARIGCARGPTAAGAGRCRIERARRKQAAAPQ